MQSPPDPVAHEGSEPRTGSILDLAAANWNTALGAACLVTGAVMLARQERGATTNRQRVETERGIG